MTEAKIKEAVRAALEPVLHQVLHPEDYDIITGCKLPKYSRDGRRKPLVPRHRLSSRLVLLLALKEAEIALMKEIMADKESHKDAKEHLHEHRR